jgi:hypothetical protein
MPFCRPDRIVVPTWTLTAGTALEGYDVDKLTDNDPSNPLRIAEPLLGLRGDLGAPTRVDGIAILHHNLAEGVTVRVRMGATPGAPDDSGTAVVTAWPGRFARHLYANVAAALPNVADRTKQYVRVDLLTPNTAPVQVGEIVVASVIDTFSGILVDAKPSLAFGRTLVEGKKGPQYIHDRRTRDRLWTGAAVLESAADIAAFDGLQQASFGVRPFLIWPLNDIADEPILARFVEPGYEATLPVDLTIAHVSIAVRELACGEAY